MKRMAFTSLLACSMLFCIYVVFGQTPPGNTNSSQNNNANPTQNPGSPMPQDERTMVLKDLDKDIDNYGSKGNWYGVAYFFFVIGAAVLSGVAGLLLQLNATKDKPRTKDVSSIMAFVAALLISTNTYAKFDANWKANKNAMTESRELKTSVLENKITTRGAAQHSRDDIFKKKQQRVLN